MAIEYAVLTTLLPERAKTSEAAGDVKHSLADIRQAKECLGYEPLVQFREGLERTVAWYKSIAKYTKSQCEGM
jgi:UDP-glucose 4-epimerase